MSRTGLLLGLLSTSAVAQVQEPAALVVVLRDPSGAPVTGAQGCVLCRAVGALPALADLGTLPAGEHGELGHALPLGQRLVGRSDGSGVLRLRPTDESPTGTAGSGFAWTDDGLGALLVDLHPGSAQRLAMQPMAALTTTTGSEVLRVFARARTAEGRVVTLPEQRGTVVRLPAADYELWVHSGDGWTWERRTLVSGKQAAVAFDGAPRRLRRDSTNDLVHPAGRLDVSLFLADEMETTLCGAAGASLLVGHNRAGGPWHGPRALPDAAPDGTVHWPPPPRSGELRAALHVPEPPDPTTPLREAAISLLRTADGTWRIAGHTTERRSGPDPGTWFQLPPPPDGDTWLLFVAQGFAPQARPWRGQDRLTLAFAGGVPLHVLARTEQGLPVSNLEVDYVPTDMEPATVTGATDERGTARLGPVLGPGVLRVSDARFANQSLPLPVIPTDGVLVTVTRGSVVRGVAKWPDGAAARGVVVTLRDPSGALRPAQRALTTGDDGAFEFAGLREHNALVLFGSAQRDGRTWSGKLDRLLAGAGSVELVLRDEDPVLGPGGR